MQQQHVRDLIANYRHWLTRPNIVSLAYAPKKKAGSSTGRDALVVGVIKKKAKHELTSADFAIPPAVVHVLDGKQQQIETDVIEEGEIRTLAGVEGGTFICTAGLKQGGALGANIDFNGAFRLVSCAHVLTAFDPSFVGKMVSYYDEPYDKTPAGELAPVTGMSPVTYYDTKKPSNPVYNEKDVAWANISHEQGDEKIKDIGKPSGIRKPKKDEEVLIYGAVSQSLETTTVTSLDVSHEVRSVYSDGTEIYTFWKDSFTLDVTKIALLPGDSGSAIVATSDNKIVGLVFSAGLLNAHGCLL